MNDFVHSCNAAATYPKNLIFPGEYQHRLQNYVDHLDKHEAQLFDAESKGRLHFWDLDDGLASTDSQFQEEAVPALTRTADFQLTTTTAQELENHIHFPPLAPRLDPICRYV